MKFQMIPDEYSRRIRRACLTAAREAGESAAMQGMVRSDNPYSQVAMREKWDDGFMSVLPCELGMRYEELPVVN